MKCEERMWVQMKNQLSVWIQWINLAHHEFKTKTDLKNSKFHNTIINSTRLT